MNQQQPAHHKKTAKELRELKRAERETKRVIARYHQDLSKALTVQEKERDKTLVFVSGGALTVTFAFVGGYLEHHQLIRTSYLTAAWVLWTSALSLTLASYTLSISEHKFRIGAVAREAWDALRSDRLASGIMEPMNIASSVLAIAGFASFAYFAIGNLERKHDDHEKAGTSAAAESSAAASKKLEPPETGPAVQAGPQPAPADNTRGDRYPHSEKGSDRGLSTAGRPEGEFGASAAAGDTKGRQ